MALTVKLFFWKTGLRIFHYMDLSFYISFFYLMCSDDQMKTEVDEDFLWFVEHPEAFEKYRGKHVAI